ncbi:hypothetical protein [Streptomyces sp. NPDC056242]|uniref:hypothetical protein n=1 Tax=Streptomyces sp. NPDC056242 TaxID=3345760 RepID=UPI0035D59C70
MSAHDDIAAYLGDAKPARDGVIATLAKATAQVREHEHPKWDDLYCFNLVSYMGERMAPVLRRLVDSEAEAERLRARVAELEYVAPSPSCTRCYGADAVRFVAQGGATAPCPVCGPLELERLRARVAELEQVKPREHTADEEADA